jgi:hypothetical protein
MSVGVVPEDGRFHLLPLCVYGTGRQLRTPEGKPVAWISDYTQSAGSCWAELAEKAGVTGLQPFLLRFLERHWFETIPPFGDSRPWDSGEAGRDPVDPSDVDALDAAAWLARRWDWPGEEELATDQQLREVTTEKHAPFGAEFPGLAPATTAEIDPELRRRALHQYTRPARVGVVPADRPADILACLGWDRGNNDITAAELSAVLRSWEDRFGARLFEVGFDEIRLLVSRPPRTLQEALPIAAEHMLFSDKAHAECDYVSDVAAAIVNNPFWDFWWD